MADIPSSDRYEWALGVLKTAGKIGNVQWNWLRKHYQSEAYTLTTMELAEIAKYETHHGVNRHYGQFGADLARQLGWPVPADGIHSGVFATFKEGDPKDPNTCWTLRPEVVEALGRLRWFPRGRTP